MNLNTAVVLVAGVAVLARIMARKKRFSHNQRLVLSIIAVCLIGWDFIFRPDGINMQGVVLTGLVVAVLGASLFFLRRSPSE